VNGHSLKLYFCMFERSQVKHNSLDYQFFLEYFPLIASLHFQSLTQIKKIACSKYSNLESGWSLFFHTSFFSTKCAPSEN